MRIELTKNIAVKNIEIIAEVDFFKESPYIELLEGFNHQKELEDKLHSDGLTKPAISNIIKNLESLGVIKSGSITDLKNGFPERELGKYKVTYYENDKNQPFKFHIKSIERVKAISQNIADDIRPISKQFLSQLNKGNNCCFTTNEKFKVLNVIDGKGHFMKNSKSETISIIFKGDKWSYKLDNKEFSIVNGIDFNTLFEGKWINNEKIYEEEFEEIKDNKKVVEQFKRDYSLNKQVIQDWGSFNSVFENIPVAPNSISREKWFIHLLSNQMLSEKQYFAPEDIEQRWYNLFYTTPQINRLGELSYNYEQIKRVFDRTTEMYWFVQAGVDLNPFSNTLSIKSKKSSGKITINEQKNISIIDALDELHLGQQSNLTIIDRYINTKRHFEVLFLLKSFYGNLDIKIISTSNYKTSQTDNKFIEDGCKTYSIERIIKSKKDIPHDRYWKMDDTIYNVSKSIDFIKLAENGNCNLKHTIFTLLDIDEVEQQAKELLGDNK